MKNGKVSIQRCLEDFFNEEVLEKDDAWYPFLRFTSIPSSNTRLGIVQNAEPKSEQPKNSPLLACHQCL